MKVLTITTVFPNVADPTVGLFIFERLRHTAQYAEVRVVAPIPWFKRRSVPPSVSRSNLLIEHPTFFYIPGVLKFLDGFFLFLSILPKVGRLRRAFDFDVIDAHFGTPNGVAAVLLGYWSHRPVVITLRGFEHQFVKYRLRRMAMRWALRRATRIIAVSRPLAALAQNLGVATTCIEVIENGVDLERFKPIPPSKAKRLLGIGDDRRLITCVGHLVPLKGFHRIIGALPHLREEFPDLALAIVGGESPTSRGYVAELQQLVARLGLSAHVTFAGSVLPDRVAQWLNASDVFVLCSDREGCPNVVWEAMACGRPVVSPKVGAVEQMVPADAGVLFDDPRDTAALHRSVTAALKINWDAVRIRKHAEGHTWSSVAQRVIEQWHLAARATNAQRRNAV